MSVQAFYKDTSGNIAILFALAFTAVVAVAGLSVDFQRSVSAEQNIQAALDSASLAGAKALQDANTTDADAKLYAQTLFAENIKMSNEHLSCPAPNVVIDRQSGTVTADVTCALPTTVGGLFSVEKVEVHQTSSSSIQISNLDLALMLDVSGSMSGDKIADLKVAAKDAVDILITPYTGDRVRIAFNTYSTSVNAGKYAEAVKGPAYDKTSPTRNCVTERSGLAKFNDDAPAYGKYLTEIVTSMGNKPLWCPSSSIEPLTNDAEHLKTEIDKLSASGWTAGHLGVAWAWYLISPDWDDIWPAASKPRNYGEKDTVKAVILMTDGAFNTYYESGQGNSDKQSKKLCKQMKDEGVIVYAVAFQAPKAGKKVLKKCASSPDYFYDAKNGQELQDAYSDIASQLMNLRITN